MNTVISKSKYISGLQCQKLLWTQYNDKVSIPKPDPAKMVIFNAGHAVGDLAKMLYPDGVEVPWTRDLAETTRATKDLMRHRRPIFEASFEADGCYCRADIMVPVENEAWDLYEVKSTTRVKDVNYPDVAFQAQVIEGCGIKLDRLYLMHIDNSYVHQGRFDPVGYFHAEDITAMAGALQPDVAANVARMHETIAGSCPAMTIGPHCFKPYTCDLWEICSGFLPKDNVLKLNRIHKTQAFALIDGAMPAIADVPKSKLSSHQVIQQSAVITGKPVVDSAKIVQWLNRLTYPLYCFDFETMNPPVPLFDGTRPYQQVPFQFSLHIVQSAGASPRHVEFLAEAPRDPRPALIEALKAIGPEGNILAFSMSFEKRIIRELADFCPREAVFLNSLPNRFEDLITPFNRFWYHDARQQGSCSLKKVLPVMTGTSYEGMEISEGGQAAHEFERVVFTDVGAAKKNRILQALRDYCHQDTLALVEILEALRKIV